MIFTNGLSIVLFLLLKFDWLLYIVSLGTNTCNNNQFLGESRYNYYGVYQYSNGYGMYQCMNII